MKKKVLGLVLSVAMVATMLVGCGSSSSDTAATTTTEETTDAATDEAADVADAVADAVDTSDANVAVFYYTFSDTYIASVRTALDAALDAAGITYQDYDSNSNQTTQNEQIDTALAQGANILVVNIVTSGSVDASQAVVDKASAAGVPVIFFNRAVETDDTEGQVLGSYDKCAFVGTDAPEAGHMQGQLAGQFILDNYDDLDLNGDGVIQYAMFKGQEGNVEAIYRTQYAVEDANAILTAAGKPELEFFDASNSDQYQVDQDGNWSATAANNYMVTNLAQYNEANGNMIEVIFCNNDSMAEGVISALNDKGYNLGTDDCTTIPVFGVDATDAAKQLIVDGKMTGTIKQDAEGMAEGIAHLVSNAAAGADLMADTDSYNISENVANKIYIPYATYTGE
jgi:methyl-galactoside transport system substrate-binding protein